MSPFLLTAPHRTNHTSLTRIHDRAASSARTTPLAGFGFCATRRASRNTVHIAVHPAVIAYARAPHFEFLSLDLLGPSLGGIIDKRGQAGLPLNAVSRTAVQMVCTLSSRRIVQRDIKRNNIVTAHDHENADAADSRCSLIDFGVARPLVRGAPKSTDLVAEVSLLPLSTRDDLESLAYTLLFLLRGRLLCARRSARGAAQGSPQATVCLQQAMQVTIRLHSEPASSWTARAAWRVMRSSTMRGSKRSSKGSRTRIPPADSQVPPADGRKACPVVFGALVTA
ncbi:hypothetical protein PLICRDRAFT_178827 [Plicaturopsis crispa FD-325 SS-3]|uniref:Protein kinase domain-containing protein n=1 Tax=Plicaturopsis crispa FD-325 SS-3 TaxID=944288 RepID=A0A0C9SL90_PLICR|nr:hypothetical protein PLICRDRAFT_178827 [Plicaturopsis crispa FD-325 SS-3]